MAQEKTKAGAAPWSGRFDEPVTELVKRYTASIAFDQRLAEFDIEGSLAHAHMLHAVEILNGDDLAAIEDLLGPDPLCDLPAMIEGVAEIDVVAPRHRPIVPDSGG